MSASPSPRGAARPSRRSAWPHILLRLVCATLIGASGAGAAKAQSIYGDPRGGKGMSTSGRHPGGSGGRPAPERGPGRPSPHPQPRPYPDSSNAGPAHPRPAPGRVVDRSPDGEGRRPRPRPQPYPGRVPPPGHRHPPAQVEERPPARRPPWPRLQWPGPARVAEPPPVRTAPAPGRPPLPAVPPPVLPAPPVRAAARPSGVPAADETRYAPGEVVFTTADAPTATAVARAFGLTVVSSQRIELVGASLTRCRIAGNRSVAAVVRALEADGRVLSAQPNYRFALAGEATAGALSAAQYALEKLHAPEAHRMAEGDRIRIAVIDSGIDGEHKEIRGALVERFDALGGPPAPEAHGTAIAGIIAARGDLTGIAPRAEILAVRAFAGAAPPGGDRRPADVRAAREAETLREARAASGTTATVVAGLDWAYGRGARIVNMSFGGPQDPLLGRAMRAAHARGMILIAAAGNEGPGAKPVYPAADPNVIAVTATDAYDRRYAQANRGAYVLLAAPGSEILVAAPAGAYQYSSGTSMAAAHVSGIAALVLSERPSLDADAVRALLARTARDLGAPGRDEDFGAGLSDAQAAVTAAMDPARPAGTGAPATASAAAPASAPASAAAVPAGLPATLATTAPLRAAPADTQGPPPAAAPSDTAGIGAPAAADPSAALPAASPPRAAPTDATGPAGTGPAAAASAGPSLVSAVSADDAGSPAIPAAVPGAITPAIAAQAGP